MDDRDLELLRTFRADEAEPPAGLQARIEEQLWQAIMAEESARAGHRSGARRRGWLSGMLRPAVAGGLALSLAAIVAVVSDGGTGPSGIGDSSVVRAGSSGLLDRTASSIFGNESAAAAAPIVGSIDLRSSIEDSGVVAGPSHDAAGGLDESGAELAQGLTRDPDELRSLIHDSIADLGADDASDALAFRVAMRWIVDPAVPTDLRAAMLRSLSDLDGIDEALTGVDVLGRSGIVLGHLDDATGIRTQAVLDPATGRLREVRSYTTSYVDPACPPGTFTEHADYADDGSWVNPAELPWVDWPLVVEACGDVTG